MKFWKRSKTRRHTRRSPRQMVLERLEDRTLLVAPVITPIADQFIPVNTGFVLMVSATDADNVPVGSDPVNLTARQSDGGLLPSWLTFVAGFGNGLGTFTSTGTVGSLDVAVTATDSGGEKSTEYFTIIAIDGPPRTLSVTSPLVNETVGVHTPFSRSANAVFTDSNLMVGQTLTLSATLSNGTVLPAWLTFSPTTNTFTGTPLDADVGAFDVKLTAVDPDLTAAFQLFSIIVPPNTTPQFVKGPDGSHLESAIEQSIILPNWATGIYEGPPIEFEQTLAFTLITDNDQLFAVLPEITVNEDEAVRNLMTDELVGRLTYTLAAGAVGTANVMVTLKDNGGGADTSDAQIFTIVVGAINDPPSFTLAGNPPTVNEDAGLQTVLNFATNISAGSPDEFGQTLTFSVMPTGGGLTFSTLPTINATTGTLTYQTAANSNGTATFNVTLSDNGGGLTDTSAIQSFTINVNAVNDPPSFTLDGNPPAVPESAGPQIVVGFANIAPVGEPGQVLTAITVTPIMTTGGLTFVTPPSINLLSGDLTYEATPGSNGTATFNVTLMDDGGVAFGGDDTGGPLAFTITVNGTNLPPTIAAPGAQSTPEDMPLVISGLSFADPDAGVGNVTVTLTASLGTLTLSTSVVNGVSAAQITGNGTANVIVTATLGQLNLTLADAAGLTYLPNLDVIGDDTLAITINDNGNTGSGGNQTANATVTITITGVNDPPTFGSGVNFGDLVVEFDDGPQTIPNFLGNISAGGPDEVTQELTFLITTDNPGLFRVLPAISSDGTLTFTPAKGFGGVATIKVTLQDDGSTDNGGSDTSDAQSFTITTYRADVSYTAFGSKKLRAVVVNGLLTVQSGGVTNSQYLPEFIRTLTLNGGSSDDLINLSGLDPTLYPNLTSILINGGKGKDAITFNAFGTGSFAMLTSLTINGGDGNDLINLTDVPTSLFLPTTTLRLNGDAGNDTIFGSDLDDLISGGAGNDSLNGLGGTDRLVESANANFKLTNSKLTGVGTDKLFSIERAALTGGNGNNKLDASAFTAGDVTLSGGNGNDTLIGGSGADALLGGDGKDSLVGGAGADTLIGGFGNDTLKGGEGNDLLIGGDGADSVDGGSSDGLLGDTGLGGNGGPGRGSDGLIDAGDMRISIETINEAFATLFAFELV
ncbi:MAG: beta strand repeat-containing protein [Planctomycetaceae bacterium]